MNGVCLVNHSVQWEPDRMGKRERKEQGEEEREREEG